MPIYVADQWTFGGVNLQDPANGRRVREMDGYRAVPPLRGSGLVRSNIPGERFSRKIKGARTLGLEIILTDIHGDRKSIHDNLDLLATVFNVQEQELPLTQVDQNGVTRTAMAHCVGFAPKMIQDHTGSVYEGVADFLMSDPWFYDLTNVISGSVPGTIHNPGTVRTTRMAFFGVNGTITNTTNSVSFTTDTSSNVDVYDFTISSGSGHLISHSGDFAWMVLEPGDNVLTGASATYSVWAAYA